MAILPASDCLSGPPTKGGTKANIRTETLGYLLTFTGNPYQGTARSMIVQLMSDAL